MLSQRWKTAFLLLSLAFLSLLAYVLVPNRLLESFSPDSVVLQVQKLSQLTTVRYRIQRVVAMTEAKQPIGEESILLMVEGEVLAGVDLAHVNPQDVSASSDKTLTIKVPSAKIFSAALDEKKTKVWDRHVTWWTPWVPFSPDFEHKARLKGIEDVRQAALDMGILAQAQTNASTALQDLFCAAGWKVTVKQ